MDISELFERKHPKVEEPTPTPTATETPTTPPIILNVDDAYEKAKAEAEVKEISAIIQSPQKALNAKLSDKIGKEIEQSEEVDRKVAETTQILVDKGLEEQRNKAVAGVINSENETIEADFNKHKDEYLFHGIAHKIDKPWKRKLVLAINDFWFVVLAIFWGLTLVPFSMIMARISALRGLIKGVAIMFAILLGLACLGGLTYGCLKWTGVLK